jgi:hypothetical protein
MRQGAGHPGSNQSARIKGRATRQCSGNVPSVSGFSLGYVPSVPALPRFYERNTIILVKPDRLRYWISSAAMRDADETLVDLQRQGY